MAEAATKLHHLRGHADAASEWLFEQALPVWLRNGLDRRHGGFHEALEQDGIPSRADFKRLRVAARQVYVFVEGATHGVPGAREAVEHGLDFILSRMRHPLGGFASRCDGGGQVIDATRDLYDLAFVLFAFAHGFRLTGNEVLRREALALLAYIRAQMRHPAGGYHESLPPRLPRRQNPHMHLLEASLACLEYMPGVVFRQMCEELTDLYEEHFLDLTTGTLGEYYADDWQPHSGGPALTEPGHHLEWAWLLTEVERVCGRRVAGAGVLAGFALRYGLDPSGGFLRGEVFADGTIASSSVRIWAHCEWLKAALVLERDSPEAGDSETAWRALVRFFDGRRPGLWSERWDGVKFISECAPASSLYHITGAVTALRRYTA